MCLTGADVREGRTRGNQFPDLAGSLGVFLNTYDEDIDYAPNDRKYGAPEDEVVRPLTLERFWHNF